MNKFSSENLLTIISTHSPFLNKIVQNNPHFVEEIFTQGFESRFAQLKEDLNNSPTPNIGELMQQMRVAKKQASLLIALADIADEWKLEQVTAAMSEIAEICVQKTLNFLLAQAKIKSEINETNGIFALAMGKLGARELNYSSDIDLIIFFDRERISYIGNKTVEHCFSKIAQELVRILQERTADGYVFRVDLRLRPDPSSTTAAMSTLAAITYYETVGQNWERAAFIKARCIAGDFTAAEQFLKQITPFVWRKHLDFAAIADIQSIKRQMDAKTGGEINIAGHNIKTGLGGIREIEFFAQINQLIWGGRIASLRTSSTCETLAKLADEGLITEDLANKFIDNYHFLRNAEHRLQMIDDQQTHTIPIDENERNNFIKFMGFTETEFAKELLTRLNFIHETFSNAFRGENSLSGEEGKLSFTGVDNDPQTIETLKKMGYQNPISICEIIRHWHSGLHRSTRTKRARELITELTPSLLKAIAANIQPDQAFMRFDEFVSKIPAGVQLFSLFNAKPELLELIAVIMGSAPAIAESLSKKPGLLDSVLTSDYYQDFLSHAELTSELADLLSRSRDFEDEMDIVRRFKNEKSFGAGVKLIMHQAKPIETSNYLSNIADVTLKALIASVEANFISKNPDIKPNNLAIIAVGRLGAKEMSFSSDIDLIFIYDCKHKNATLSPNHVTYNKLSQRIISAVSSLTGEGRLYEVDTRLRPSGKDGSLAVSINAFEKYFNESAWIFELMAFTKARVITGNKGLKSKIENIIKNSLTKSHDNDKLVKNITDLRAKISKEFGSSDIWNLKYVHGGLLDIDFITQYFILLNAHKYPEILTNSSDKALEKLIELELIDDKIGNHLLQSYKFMNSLLLISRLCGGGVINETKIPQGLKNLITSTLELPSFEQVKVDLIEATTNASIYFSKLRQQTPEYI